MNRVVRCFLVLVLMGNAFGFAITALAVMGQGPPPAQWWPLFRNLAPDRFTWCWVVIVFAIWTIIQARQQKRQQKPATEKFVALARREIFWWNLAFSIVLVVVIGILAICLIEKWFDALWVGLVLFLDITTMLFALHYLREAEIGD